MKIGVIKKFYFDFLTFLKGEGFFNDNNIMIYKFDNFNEVEIALKSGFLDIALSSNALLLEDSDYFDQIIFIKNAFKIFGYQNFKEKITGEREILKVAIPQKSINFKKYFYSFYKFFCGKSEKIQWIQTDYEDLDILFERNFIDFAIVYEPLTFDIISKRFASLLVHKNKNEIPLSFVYPKDLIDNEKIKNFNNAVSNIRKSLIETNLLDKFLSVEGSKCLCLKNYSSIFLQSFSFDQSHNKNSTDAKNKVNDLKDAKISKLGKYNNYVSYYGDEFTSLFQKEINKIIHYGMDQLNECNDTTIYELNLIKKLIENLKNKEKINKLKILALKEKNSTLLEDLANRQQVLSDLFMQFKTTSENLIIKNIQVEQTIKDKDRLIAVISHDLKTPLSGILAISEQLLENENNEEKKKKLYIINESGNTLLMLINNLLESAKNESLSKKLEEKIFDIKKIIESISSNIEEKIKNKNIEFKLIYNNSIPQILYGDPMKLNQIIYNLLGNSAKFTQKGFIELKVDLLEKDQDFCKLLFQVKDTGIGISEDKIEHIFDPFVQEDESIKDKFGGTGLGLSIVKEFVELMGGKISVQSRKNEGTVFEVILSFNIPVKQHNREKIEDIHRYINFKESNILILEDNLINQEIIKGYLNDYKTLKITFKQNGKEGLKEVKNKKYDLIMSDIMMPEMDGKEFCKRFREIDKITPLIALTAFDDSKEIEELKKIGYNFIISKPYKKDELINGLSNYIAINEIFSDEKKLIDLAEKAKNSDKIDRFKKLFLMDLKDRYAELKYGIEKKDKEKMKFFCHNLKGIAPTLGYPEFAELAEKASALYKEDKWEELLIIKDEFFKNLELIEKSL